MYRIGFNFCFCHHLFIIRTPTSPHMGVFSRTNPTAAFNYVISQIASGDVTASTQSLVQFERVIRNKNHKEVSKHIDQVRFPYHNICGNLRSANVTF